MKIALISVAKFRNKLTAPAYTNPRRNIFRTDWRRVTGSVRIAIHSLSLSAFLYSQATTFASQYHACKISNAYYDYRLRGGTPESMVGAFVNPYKVNASCNIAAQAV